jgi:preprotein translocase subunit SecA
MLGEEFMGHLERIAILQTIDDKWREHLRVMDELKEGIHLRAYGQKDPLLEYKSEAFKLFMELEQEINSEAVQFAFRFFPQVQERVVNVGDGGYIADASALPRMMTTTSKAMQFSRPDASTFLGETVANAEGELQRQTQAQEQAVKRAPVVNAEPKIGRNDPCPLDGKKKFKNCCGATGEKHCVRLLGN